jgi:hypothetical protein
MRRFIRHPTDFPILVSISGVANGAPAHLCDISQGGFACQLERELLPNDKVTLNIPCLNHAQRVAGRVVYCKAGAQGYRVGIQFDDEKEAFKLKMVEQVCQIEHYRCELRRKGRELDAETAAHEWINRFGKEFSDIFSGRSAK